MRRTIAIFVGVALAASAAFVVIARPFESRFLRLCEEVAMVRFSSPASYSRIAVTERSEAISIDLWEMLASPQRYVKDPVTSRQADRLRTAGATPAKLTSFVTFDIENAFGAMIRGGFQCSYLSPDGGTSGVSRLNIEVDGRSLAEWLRL